MFKRFFWVWLALGAVLSGLYGADQFLAHLEKRELAAQARSVADEGNRLLAQGSFAEAIEDFRQAHNLERENRHYEQDYADALIRNRETDRAVDALNEILAADSNDGPANLLMARAMALGGDSAEADSFFHRAIYGTWPRGEGDRKSLEARLELVRWLSGRGDRKALFAEVIPLEQAAKSDPAIAREIPGLYLQAGALPQAKDAYNALAHREPDDPRAYAGMGRVDLQQGDFRAAMAAFDDALRRKPGGDAALAREAEIARKAHDLDPTPRRLTSSEKLGRSNQILAMADCAGADSALHDAAAKLLTEKPPRSPRNEDAEVRLDLAEKLWHDRPAGCQKTEILRVLMRKIAQ